MLAWVQYAVSPVLVVILFGFGLTSLLADIVPDGTPLAAVLFVFDTRVLITLAVAIFLASFLLYLYYLQREDSSLLVGSGRSVEVVVPVYNDAEVMHKSVEGLAGSAYDDLTVTIVCEPDDHAAIERAEELAAAHDRVRYFVNRDRQGSKAGALNAAIERSDADVVGMFDADQEPHPKLVPHAMAYFDDHDIIRVRSIPKPSGGILESMAYYEYLLLFFLPQKLVKSLFGLRFAGTRSVFVAADVFDEVGLFSEGHLTEDIDFTHCCHQAGMSIRELLYYPAFEEPAHSFSDWWGQRTRWMTGQVQVTSQYIVDWRRLHEWEYLSSLLSLVGTLVAGVLLALTLPKLAVRLVKSPLIVGLGLVGIFGISLATRAVDSRTADMRGFELSWLLMPVALTLFGLVIVKSILTYAAGRDPDWYQVEKGA